MFNFSIQFVKSNRLAGTTKPLAAEQPTHLFEWLAVPAGVAPRHRPTHTFISAISLCAQTRRLYFVAPHLGTTSLCWLTSNDKRSSAASKKPILSTFFTTQGGGGVFSGGPLSHPRCPEWMWRKPLAVACNCRSSSKWHLRLRIADGIYN